MDLSLSSNAQDILRQVRTAPPRMLQAVARAIDRENQHTIGHIQRAYLTGPRPQKLGVVTNRLRGSIHAAPAVVNGSRIDSSIGTNVAYAGVHEFGFDGEVQVREHQRNVFGTFTKPAARILDLSTGRIRNQKSRRVSLLTGTATVRAHRRHMKVLPRPFLQPGLADSSLSYSVAISHAIESSWSGGAS